MTTLFVADLHLDASRPAIVDSFIGFLARVPAATRAVYVLGDLFEAWIGDDDDAPLPRVVADALSRVARSGVPISFMHGNRDFLLGERYAQACGMALLPESSVHDVEGTPTLLMHGDTLCTEDLEYQAFRRRARDPAWQASVLSQPLAARRELAARARAESERHTATSLATIMDVDERAVRSVIESAGVARLIHGHTHRRAIHAFDAGGGIAERIVLGDWYEAGSVLVVEPDGFRFESI